MRGPAELRHHLHVQIWPSACGVCSTGEFWNKLPQPACCHLRPVRLQHTLSCWHILPQCCTALLGRGQFCCCLQLTPALASSLQNASQVDYLVLDNQVVHQQALAPSSGKAAYTASGSTSVCMQSPGSTQQTHTGTSCRHCICSSAKGCVSMTHKLSLLC